ncbi:MAG: bifunctional sulfate adenylyltransferase/adenylylsulfate kinase [Desulfobacteraceae bacterium]|nr:MAG: bifunctional sulfate adenylyltransferase/adenylylsulfate kinase [Desulfobacteraceae bacterium]
MLQEVLPDKPGNGLVNLLVDHERAAVLKDLSLHLSSITLNDHQLCDIELLTTGAFSPLDGFMVRTDYESVLDRMQLQDGTVWPLPVCLGISAKQARQIESGQSVAIRDPEGFLLAIMHVEDIWPIDKQAEASATLGTTDLQHPWVRHLFEREGSYYVGGKLEVLSLPLHFDFKQLRRSPREVSFLYKKLGWKRVVCFQTRHPIHKPQFEMTLKAMQEAKANLLILPIVGLTMPDDFDYYTRVRCYQEALRYYPPGTTLLNLLPLSARMAGPREGLLHAILARNYGCAHLIVGHNHANPGIDSKGISFYESRKTREMVTKWSEEIDMSVIGFDELVYLPFEDEYRTRDEVAEGIQTQSMSADEIRRRTRLGRSIPEWATFPEVVTQIRKAYPSPRQQGFTIFLTGLSGAGKSTIAKVLYAQMLEIGERPVTLLDGDIVRRHLSNELSFSKEHRDINVRRIGFVASEITKNRGIAICAPIAPYANTRKEIRESIEAHGGFIEVHISTPIAECEKRDRKGMYAKAKAGLIKGFTGVDDPYEIPETPELRIDTTGISPDEAAQEILLFLGRRGYI